MNTDLQNKVFNAIYALNVDAALRLLRNNNALIDEGVAGESWLHIAAGTDSIEMVHAILDLGIDINTRATSNGRTTSQTPLICAIRLDAFKAASFLVGHGADTNIGHPVISAIVSDMCERVELVTLLHQHGADLHVVYPYGEDGTPMNPLKMAMIYQRNEIVDYLRAHGAKLPEEYSPEALAAYLEPYKRPPTQSLRSTDEDVIAYFGQHVGPVDPRALIEVVPSEPPIAIHAVPPAAKRRELTLFSTGLSAQPMRVPADDPEGARFRYAELFIELPGDWKYQQLEDPNWGWPVHWLRHLGKFPAQHDTWLGGPVTVFDAGMPLGPNLRFDSLLLFAEKSVTCHDGRLVQLFRLTPLYPEERELEAREGIAALMHAFDEKGVSFVVDLRRKSAV